MNKSKSIIMVALALVMAIIVAVMLKRPQKKPPVQVTQSVVVAAIDLGWGVTLNKEMVKTVDFLKTSLPAGTFSDPSVVAGRTIRYPAKAGEPIFESKLAPTTVKSGGVAALITPKKRAMAVKVDKVSGISGFINPDHRVDVLVTLMESKEDKKDEEERVTKTVLENILVLAAGKQVEQQTDKKEKPVEVDVITLEVTPDEAEKLALAAVEGRIQLALRSYVDTEAVKTEGVTVPILLASCRGEEEKPGEKPKNKPIRVRKRQGIRKAAFTVEFIRGNEISKLTFERGM